jgi:tetratricopeptide (TPR) repeat protein
VARCLNNLATVVAARGRLAEAEDLFREAIAIKRRTLGSDHPEVANSLSGLASALLGQGKLAEAETSVREALAITKNSSETDAPVLADAFANLAQILVLERQFVEAENLARQCRVIREKRLLDQWPTFDAQSLLGATLLGQKNYAAAEPPLVSSYQGLKQRAAQIPGTEKHRLKETLQCLVRLYEATGKADEAAKWKQELATQDR